MAANRIAILFAFGVFLLNLLLGSWDAPATGDGYEEIRLFREETRPRPQHLLLTPTWRTVHRAVSAVSPDATPLRTIVIANAACSAIALGLALRIGTLLGIPAGALVGALGVLAVSWAWWMHSRDPETTMLAHALLVAGAFVLMRGRMLRNHARLLCIALFTLAAAMAANVMATMPMLVLLERWRAARPRHHPRTLLFALALVLPFFAIALAQHTSHREEIRQPYSAWIVHHSSEEMMGAIPRGVTAAGLLRAGSGFLRTFFPLEGGVPAAAKLLLTGREGGRVTSASIAAFAIAAVSALVVLMLFARAAAAAPEHRSAFQAFGVGFLGTAIGSWIWLGSDPQFWLPILPFVFIGAAAGWKTLSFQGRRWTAGIAAAAFVFFFVVNAPWPTPSLLRRDGGPSWRAAGQFCKSAHPGDLLVVQDTRWSFYAFARCPELRVVRLLYGSPATGDALLGELESAIDETLDSGRRVWVEDLCDEPDLEHLGFWENMALVKKLPREEICARLGGRYTMVELLDRGELRLYEMKRRT
jgi:hypothetical protein